MMNKSSTILILFLGISIIPGFQSVGYAQNGNELFTIYLVRHSEKDLTSNNGGDPPLTQCGAERSKHLSSFLSHVHLDAVYTTDYTRTKNTALPTASSKGLESQEYSAQDLEGFAKLLIERKQDVLVVGHSNTTGVLAGILVGEELADIDLDIYNRVYQVVIHDKGGRLHLFHTSFDCKD
jgi:broad specificity phosphatase PhoE